MQSMHDAKNPQTAALVRSAREHLGLNQGQFAAKIGKSQGVVSRYERGVVDPPGEIVMHCMHILRHNEARPPPQTSSWPDLLMTLEAAVAIAKSMRDAVPDLSAGDTEDKHFNLPRQA
jgi:transcriptional regulator with XRE-family HTH domain